MPISDVLLDEGGAFYNVTADAFGADNTGGSDAGPAIAAADAQGHTLMPAGTYRIDNPLTLTNTARFVEGAILRPANGVTITLNGTVEAGLYKIFDLSLEGTVAFGSDSAAKLYPHWWGAVGGGANDTVAIQHAVAAAAPVKGTVAFPSDTTHVISETIIGAPYLRWSFNRTRFVASEDGMYKSIIDSSGNDTGLKVFFATDNAVGTIYEGALFIDGNDVPNLCGISGADGSTSPQGRGLQRWDSVRIDNCERGIFAVNQQGQGGNTLVGHHFGTVQFFGNGYDLYLEDNGADDLVFDVVRSQSVGANGASKDHIFLDRARGVVIHSLFVHGGRSDRRGIVISHRSSLVCNHVYVEGEFDRPIQVGGLYPCFRASDLKVANGTTSTDGEVINIGAGSEACFLDVLINDRVTSAGGISHLVRINADDNSTYGRTVIIRIAFGSSVRTPVLYEGAGRSDNDDVVVYARDGKFRYFYDGTTTTALREPLVNGGTVAVPMPTLGNVVRRMEVFDAQGNSLGFIPVYDSIV